VKKAVTDYGGSSKAQVQEMVTVLLGLESPPRSSDAADALAVAICHANASRDLELVISE
jgi:crossover junction endodeoxyribonuclease RuvC